MTNTTAVDAVMTNLNRVSDQLDTSVLRYIGDVNETVLHSIEEEVVVGLSNGNLYLVSVANYSDLDYAYAMRPFGTQR